MRCLSYCLGNELKLALLYKDLKRAKVPAHFYGDVLAVQYPEDASSVFYFANGTLVMWNVFKKRSAEIRSFAQNYVVDPFDTLEQDEFSYRYSTRSYIKPHGYFNVDLIYLNGELEDQLAISYALGQSVKLQAYEQQVTGMVNRYAPLMQDLAMHGRIHVSRREIPRIMGRIFLLKSSINLKSEYLNVPKYFWEYCSLEPEFKKVEKYMDILPRVDVLNQKLDVLSEIFDTLDGQLQHRQSSALEVIIIVLIGVEIVFSMLELWLLKTH